MPTLIGAVGHGSSLSFSRTSVWFAPLAERVVARRAELCPRRHRGERRRATQLLRLGDREGGEDPEPRIVAHLPQQALRVVLELQRRARHGHVRREPARDDAPVVDRIVERLGRGKVPPVMPREIQSERRQPEWQHLPNSGRVHRPFVVADQLIHPWCSRRPSRPDVGRRLRRALAQVLPCTAVAGRREWVQILAAADWEAGADGQGAGIRRLGPVPAEERPAASQPGAEHRRPCGTAGGAGIGLLRLT